MMNMIYIADNTTRKADTLNGKNVGMINVSREGWRGKTRSSL